MKADNLKSIALLFAVLLPMAEVSLGDTFVSSAFTLDMRLENGRRIARGTEAIRTCAIWDAGDFATVTQTRPGGSPATIHTTSGTGVESVSWDAKHAEPGDHLFTHVTSRGGSTVATYSVTFEVPEPSLEAIRIFGPTNFYSGNSAQYICMGYFSDDSGCELVPEWSMPNALPGMSVDGDGLVSVEQQSGNASATLRAIASVGDVVLTNDFEFVSTAASLSLDKKRLILERTAGEGTVAVFATGEWRASSSESWLVVSEGTGSGDGLLVVSFDRNPDAVRRLATITVTCGSLVKVVPVMQAPSEPDDTVMVAFDAQGGSANYSEREYVVGTAYGSLPSASFPGKVFGGWWTLPGGQGVRILAGSEVSVNFKRLYAFWRDVSIADALDCPLAWMEANDAPWVIDATDGRTGGSCMRSGAISRRGTSSILVDVVGPGKLSFWWRTSSDIFDYLSFYDGDEPVDDISGNTGWLHYEYTIGDSATHNLVWSYEKYSGSGDGLDCAWLDEVIWMPDFPDGAVAGQSAENHDAPSAWREMYGLGESSLDGDSDGDGMTDWEEFVAGTNPLDPSSVFRISISVSGGVPELFSIPDLGNARGYTLEGKSSLSDLDWESPTNSSHRFFRVKVDLK